MLETDRLIRLALEEDIGAGDLTTEATVDPASRCRARIIAREEGILSGISVCKRVFEIMEAGLGEWDGLSDGDPFQPNKQISLFTGRTAAVLSAERVALNFIQRLSGIATTTRQYVQAAAEHNVSVCETRKTTPLLRGLEKRAVRDGGGRNHRQGLHDAILIKENHVEAAGGMARAIKLARSYASHMTKIEVEVRNLVEFDQALNAGPDVILLDNMSVEEMQKAVRARAERAIVLEASGNMTLERVRDVAMTGVDVISVGALTHSAPSIDFSLLISHE